MSLMLLVSYPLQVFGVGIPNPYRLRPFIGARVPVNSSFSPLINIHNPHSEPLQVVEMYSSGGDLHLELPTGQQGGTHHLWVCIDQDNRGLLDYYPVTSTQLALELRQILDQNGILIGQLLDPWIELNMSFLFFLPVWLSGDSPVWDEGGDESQFLVERRRQPHGLHQNQNKRLQSGRVHHPACRGGGHLGYVSNSNASHHMFPITMFPIATPHTIRFQ